MGTATPALACGEISSTGHVSSLTTLQHAVAAAATATGRVAPPERMLIWLEELEPMLAMLPVGVVPGMEHIQEDACEAYGRLREALWAAASTQHPQMATLPGGSQARVLSTAGTHLTQRGRLTPRQPGLGC